eukprot:Nitzschia sp. Nitz4//scaffold28_size193895//102524//102745//NITZ4_001662-RA/size193895-est2genome-gene-0.177-mRNA-1//1//CDS//3329545973//6799//frame0
MIVFSPGGKAASISTRAPLWKANEWSIGDDLVSETHQVAWLHTNNTQCPIWTPHSLHIESKHHANLSRLSLHTL